MKITDSIKQNGSRDLLASVVVFLVALPLCTWESQSHLEHLRLRGLLPAWLEESSLA